MKLIEALKSGSATKHVNGPLPGTYTVDKANISAGYYKDFEPDDPAQRTPFNTSVYYSAREISSISYFVDIEEGWE